MEPSCTASGITSLKDSLEVSHEVEHSLVTQSSHSTPRYSLKRNENTQKLICESL